MRKITILTVLAIMFAMNLNATVWTVNNYHGAADFTTLQDAIDGASAGDTLYIEGSAVGYGDGILDKQLVIIGAGYWLNENDTTQANKESSRIGKITFNSGSENSVIEGLYLYYSSSSFNLITINADGINIARNFIYPNKNSASPSGYGIYINGDRSNITIKQNWIDAKNNDIGHHGSVYGIYFSGIPTNCLIMNNFIRSYQTGAMGETYAIALNNNSSNYLRVVNNVIWGTVTTFYTEHTNNILLSGSYNNGLGDGGWNNICNSTQYPAGNNNQQNIEMNSVFVDYEKYIDNGYILKDDSPANGAGILGGDCGVFGSGTGTHPYVLSGMPEIPAIFEATVTPVGTTSLPVNIKATSHNENK